MNSRSKLSFTGLFMIIILLIIAMNCPVAFAADCEDEILVVGNALTSSTVRGITEIDEDQLVWVIVKVDERSLVDANQTGIQWRDFLASEQGRLFRFELEKSQDDILCKIRESGLDYRLGYSYYTLFNGFSLKIRYGDLGAIRNIKGVSDTVLSDWYAAPTAEQSIMHARYFAESVRKYTGKGMSVAVLDTGVNYEHTAFAKAPEYVAYTESQILDLIDELGLRGSYVSPKIPYAFDYADGDSDVYPDNQHGTHVSGISVGSDDVICGAAPDAQLIAMKVFANGTGNAYQTDIVKAVEDAVLLGVDAINLSLGSNAGFTVERDSSAQFIDAVYNMAGRSGVFVCCSAGNGYSSAFGIEGGGAFPQNPDYGILASPSTYTGSFSVASIDTYEIFSLEARGEKFTYTETVNEDRVKNMLMDVFLKECGYGDYDYVTVGGYGEEGDYEGLDVKGKVTLVKRGEISFEEKARIASENGAVFCLVWNNENTGINPMVTNITIPVVIIDKYIGEYLAGADGGVLSFSESNRTIGMSDFSSWGTTADLDLKPDLTAPGGGIYSAYGDSYTSMSGTSMASPYVAGAAVSAKQYVREVFGYGLTPKEEQGLVYSLLMSTADIVYDAYGNPYPVRKQGAGLINPEAAYSTKVMLAVRGSERAKIRLGDDKDRVGAYNIAFDAVNFSDEDVEYTVDVLTLYERIRFDNILSGYAGTLSPEIRVICNNDITDGVVRIGANSVASIIISVVLSEESKLFLNENYVNGAFIEGFARLSADGEPALSIPYLTFYGDFAAIPAFDSDVYDDEKCQVYETRLLGLLGNTNVVQMGRYCYELPEGYEMPEDDPDKIALSYFNGAVNTFYQIQAGLLKNISRLEYTVTDKYTGEAVWSGETYNVKKSYFSVEQNALYVAPVNADLKVSKMNLSNNQELLLTLRAYSCYDESVYDQVEYPITVDFEYPRLMGHSFRQEDGRIILDLQVFDNQYLQDIQIYTYNSNKQYEIIDSYAIPVYGFRKGHTNSFSLDVTRYMELVQNNILGIKLEDYAFNYGIYGIDISGVVPDPEEPNKDFVIENGILKSYKGTEKVIVIPESVTEIDESVFRGTDIEKVIFNRALKKIGAFAFWSCKSLKEIVFPEDNELVTIGSNAFQATESLKLANLEALSVWQATAAESYQFHGTGLEKVVLPASMVKLESQFIFASCGSLIELVLPEGLEEIAAHAFRNGGALEELNIPSSVKVIGSLSFFRSGIKRINSLAAEPPALTDVNVFFPIGDVTKVVVPAASIDSYKKAKVWSSLASVIVGAEEPDKLYGKISVSEMPSPSDDFIIENGVLIKYVGPGGDVVLPEGITRIADNAFRSNQTVTSVVMQSGITEMGMCVFWDCHYIKRIVFSDTIKVIPTSTCYLNWALEEVILPRDVEEIQSTAFINCYALTSLDFSKYNIRIFGEQSFMGSGLQEVYFSKNVKVIGRQAFLQCYRLKNVTFEEGIELEFLGASVFSACIMLEEVDLSMLDMKELPSEIFRLCSALTKVKLPSQLTSIPWGLFNSCTSLREIDLSDTKITVLNNYVFYKCTSLERVILPERLTEIMKGTFSDTASLEYIVIPESVTKIGNDAFKGSGIKAIVFNSPVPPALGSGIFLKHNDELRVFVPSDSAEAYKKALGEYSDLVNSSSEFDIRDGVLYKYFGCSEEVTVPYEVKSIAAGAFKGNATLRSVYIGGITAGIGTEAFEGCSSLSYVYLSQSVKTIKDRAFGGCGSLARVVIDASVPPKTGKEVFPLNDGLVIEVIDGAREVYAREWKRYEKLIVENGFTVVDGVLVCYKGIAKDVIVPEGVTELGKYVFQGCAYMETLTLPEGLIKLGDGAINSCNSLRSIKFPDSLSDIGTDSLSFNKSLECLDIPVNVTRIRQNAVRFNDSMTRLNVYCNLNLTGIAFVSLNNLSEIHFYGVIENISNLNFTCMPCLSKVVFYNTVLSLGGEEEKNFDAPFAFNAKLTTVEFRDTVIALGGKAFSNCISLSEVTLYGNLMNLGRSAFSACTKLKGIVASVDNLFLSNDEYGLLYNKDKTHLFRAMEGWDFDGEYIMPDSVVIMDDYAFSVPEVYVVEVQNIIDIMFSGLGEWNINNFRFTGIKISDKLVSIGAGAFCGCKNLKNVTFGSEGNLKYIMSYAFASTGVVNIELPEGLQLLEERAFYKCSDLTRVVVPVGVSAFNFNMVFEGCDSLTDFVVDENTDIFRIIDGVMFNKEMTVLYFYPSDKEDKEYVVPEGVVKIAANAFYNNRFLSKVTLPESLAVIGDKAFFGTENLTIYVMKSKKPPVLEGRFVSDKTDYYANFYCYIEDIGSRDMTLYYPANAEYNDRIWETYFRNRYKIGREREINDSGYIVAPGRVTEDRYSLTLGLLSANEKQNVISRETEPVFRNETETARYDTARDSAVLTDCPATAVSDRSTAELVAGVLLLAALSCVFKKRR